MADQDACTTGPVAPGGPGWTHIEHQADIGVRGFGRTCAEAFEQAALALTAVAVADVGLIRQAARIAIACENPDRELLLVDWLNAVILEMARRRMLFSRFEVRLEGERLEAAAWGERVDPDRHQPAVEVKGASYAELRVGPAPGGGWLAQCIVDV